MCSALVKFRKHVTKYPIHYSNLYSAPRRSQLRGAPDPGLAAEYGFQQPMERRKDEATVINLFKVNVRSAINYCG